MLAFLPASVLAREIATRRVSPIDVVDEFLERIAQYNGRLNAFASVYEEDARLAARAADTAIRAGHVLGPYHGVPIALKDLIEIEGRITTGGSAHFLNRQSTVTATLVRQLLAQGMIVLGKTQTVEFAFSGWGLNQHLGTPWNPWDLLRARTPGGSSSGSGVAVAGGLAPWAIGTDTGGSVRLPASFCGVTGLKPTIGRMSTHGILPLSNTFDTPGILGRNVLDTTLLFKVLQGPDPLDVNTRGVVPVDPLPTLKRGVIGLRLARMPAAEHEGVDSEVLAAYASALDCLAKAGALIVDVKLPFRFTDVSVRKGIRAGRSIAAYSYLAAVQVRKEMGHALYCSLSNVDALLTPTTETAALPIDEIDDNKVASRFTRFVNSFGMCALAVPSGFTVTGLPLSLQIVCRGLEESMALRIGYAFQQMTGHHLRTPGFPPS
jgi:aspartyl-tRNA(Asn)/glutamyl-tRNA(Gln) amidotransferase subunit A